MRILRYAMVLAVAMIVVLGMGSAEAAKKNKKGIKGVITNVESGKEQATLTIKVTDKKSGVSKDVKVTVDAKAKIEKMIGKKKDNQTAAASLSELVAGKRVIVTPKPGQADQANRVLLSSRKKKNNV